MYCCNFTHSVYSPCRWNCFEERGISRHGVAISRSTINFVVQKAPSKQPRSTHFLLPHVTTLLMYDDRRDNEAKKVAVASSVKPGQWAPESACVFVCENHFSEAGGERPRVTRDGDRISYVQLRVDCNVLTHSQLWKSRLHWSLCGYAICPVSLQSGCNKR